MQQESETILEFIRRTDELADRAGLNLSELPEILGFSKPSLFAYRSGKNRITNKVWLKLESAERTVGISATLPVPPSPAPLPSAPSSAPPRFDSSSAEPELLKVLAELLETNRRIAAALERLADQSEENL